VERAAAMDVEVQRLEEAAAELEERARALSAEMDETRTRIGELTAAISSGEAQLDEEVLALEAHRAGVRAADEAGDQRRRPAHRLHASITEARSALEEARAVVAELDIARATAETDLSHLASTCVESVQASLDEVLADVEQLERDGAATPDANVMVADEGDDEGDGQESLVES